MTCPHGWAVVPGEGCPTGSGCNEGRSQSWAERYATDCPDHCPTRPGGHVEGCPTHCGCYDEPSDDEQAPR